jgi:acetyl esterase/lipase
MQITDWDDAYAQGIHIPDADAIIADWQARAPVFRDAHRPKVLSYGASDRHRVDLYRPDGAAKGLVVFMHGGYWMGGCGADYAHLAGGALARGYAVALPSHTLAPDAALPDITAQVAQAISLAAAQVDGPIYLSGHSAGGHLVTRMMCAGVLPEAVAARVVHVLSISGVHDLRPLLRTGMAATLHLTPHSAIAESPALQVPLAQTALTCVVGTLERPEFLRQADLLANIWTGLGAMCRAVHLPGANHFGIIDGLSMPDGILTAMLLDQVPGSGSTHIV